MKKFGLFCRKINIDIWLMEIYKLNQLFFQRVYILQKMKMTAVIVAFFFQGNNRICYLFDAFFARDYFPKVKG
jgi:hypothetical protein